MEGASEMNENYIVRGVSELGREWFYTGKAGTHWVSEHRENAFTYSMERARSKALMFNRTTELHGLRFIAVRQEENQ